MAIMKFVLPTQNFYFELSLSLKLLLIYIKISLKSPNFQGLTTLNSIVSGNWNKSFLALHYWGMSWKLTKNGLRIFQDDFSEKVKNIHDEMEKHHSYKKKRVNGLRITVKR